MTLAGAALLAAQEEREYTDLQRVKDAAARRAQCDAFLARHPQSWFLAGVYDSAATASIELGDYQRAMSEARMSLRLVPENASLLVALASVQAKAGLRDPAERNARDALYWLEHFDRPGNIAAPEWKKTKDDLAVAAWFVLARVYATGAFASRGPRKEKLLRQSADALADAIQISPADANVRKLQQILEENGVTLPVRMPAEAASSGETREEYAGSDACRACHSAVFQSWQASGMARMFRQFKPENALAGFGKPSGYDDLRTVSGDRPAFEFLAPGSGWKQIGRAHV
jgi:tetratricopeptide (TPR) repeat protein